MRRFFPFLVLASLCGLLLSLPPARASDPPRRAVAGSFMVSRDNGTPLVEVEFSSGKTGLFAIDTGAYDCVMTPACVKRLGYKQDDDDLYLRNSAARGAAVPDGFTISSPTVHISGLLIGRLRVEDIRFRVATGEIGTENGRPLDGLLGGNLLSRFALLLDYPHRSLSWIYPGNLDDATVAGLGLDPKSALGLHQESYFELSQKINHYSTRVPLQNGEQHCAEEMYFDTGSPMTFLSIETAHRLKLVSSGQEPFQFVFQTPDLADKSMVPTLQIGPQIFSDVAVIYPTHSSLQPIALIGANILGDCLVLFDFGPHRCFLKPTLPGLVPGPLPTLDSHQVDWERLRNAPEPLGFSTCLLGMSYTGFLEGLPARRSTETQLCESLQALLSQSGDDLGAKLTAEQNLQCRQATAGIRPDDAECAALLTNALALAGQSEPALAAAQKNAVRWPDTPAVWRALGFAQESRAVFLLFGNSGKCATDEQASDPSVSLGPKPVRPSLPQAQQIGLLRSQAQDSYRKAAALAPSDPASYNRRARFWLLDGLLRKTLDGLGVKGQAPTTDAALAAEMADFRTEAHLLPDNPDVLRRVVLLDKALPQFHNDGWLRKHLRGTGQELDAGSAPLTEKAALAHLTALSDSPDPRVAAPALEALGALQLDRDDPAAEATLRRALARDPARPGALASLTVRMVSENRRPELGDLLLKQTGKSQTPASCLLLSETLGSVGQSATAEEEAREALKALPDSPAVNMALARLLLARSGDDPAVLPEAAACLTKAEAGLGAFASPQQKASLQTMRAVAQALSGDLSGARAQLLKLAHDQPTCTQAREALYALSVPPAAP